MHRRVVPAHQMGARPAMYFLWPVPMIVTVESQTSVHF
jgi:hypothetical protein